MRNSCLSEISTNIFNDLRPEDIICDGRGGHWRVVYVDRSARHVVHVVRDVAHSRREVSLTLSASGELVVHDNWEEALCLAHSHTKVMPRGTNKRSFKTTELPIAIAA